MEKAYIIKGISYTQNELISLGRRQLETAADWEKSVWQFIVEWFSDKDYIEAKTSGSTSIPKNIILRKTDVSASASLTAKFFHMMPESKVLLCLPVEFIAGKMVVARALVNGWNLDWVRPTENPLADIDQPFDFVSITPMQLYGILELNPEKLNMFRKILVGGGIVSNELENRLSGFDNEIFLTYGMTETISHVAVRRLGLSEFLFKALPGIQFSQDENGCLLIEADHLEEKKVRTNDVVELTTPTSFRFLGRLDNVVNSGGIKFFPEDIENRIAHLLTAPFYITSELDERLGEKLVMFIEGKSPGQSDIQTIKSAMSLLLKPYEVPKEIRYVEKLDRTDSGKIKRIKS